MSNLQIESIDGIDKSADKQQSKRRRNDPGWTERALEARQWDRQHEVEWARVDQKLRGIAARRAALDAEEAHLLRYAEELKLWRAYGFGSILEYMERVMGYAPHTATERLRVARAIAELPLIAEAMASGELAHSAVRELSRVAVPDTEAAWLEAARGKSLREIEALVSGHRPGHLPTDKTEPRLHRRSITLELSPETYDIWRKLHALAAEEHGQRLSDDELVSSLFRRAYGGGGKGGGNCERGSGNCERGGGGNHERGGGNHERGGGSCERGGGSNRERGGDCISADGDAGHSGNHQGECAADRSNDCSDGANSERAGDHSSSDRSISGAGDNHLGSGSDVVSSNSIYEGGRGTGGSVRTCKANHAGPAYKIAIKQCPDCKRAWQYSGGRDIEIDPAVAECAACDAIHLGSLDVVTPARATTTVTPRKREQVLARDGHCCTVPGCRRNIGLDLHHIEYQSRGGGHDCSNITILCDLHHRAVHFGKLVVHGTAPDRLTFEFRKPRDRRNVTDDDMPALRKPVAHLDVTTSEAPSPPLSRTPP